MNETNTIQPRKWYWLFSGFSGNSSTFISPFEKTGKKDGGYYNLTGITAGKGPAPMVDEWRAIGLDGRIVTISANNLDTAGSIGIGTIQFRPNAKLYLYCEDVERLRKVGYTEQDVFDNFGCENSESEVAPDLTDKMIEMLNAIRTIKEEEDKAIAEEENRLYQSMLAECKRIYSYLPCKMSNSRDWLRTGEVSRNLRAMLKVEFPGVKFSVSSKSYSGGDSATVEYEDGPAYSKVNAIVSKFETKSFDAMQDLAEDCSTAFNDFAGGFSYTHLHRKISDGVCGKIRDLFIEKGFGKYDDDGLERMVSDVCDETDFDGRAIVDLKYIEKDDKGNWVDKWEVVFKASDKPTGGDDKPKAKSINGIEVTENKEKNGVEIRFSEIPSEEIRSELKRRGFRWSKFNKCWYNRATDENRAYAHKLAKMAA